MLERGLWAIQAPCAWTASTSAGVRCTQCASSVRAPIRPWALQPLRERQPVSAPAVLDVGAVLGDVNVQAAAASARTASARRCRLVVAQREAGVGADHPARQLRLLLGLECAVLLDAQVASLGAVAIGHLVAQHGAQPDALQAALQRRQRARDAGGRGVMVHEQRRARKRRLDRSRQRRQLDRLGVERAVEPPPDPLEDLEEAAGRRARPRHAARQGGVEMGVRVHQAGQNQRPRQLESLLAAARGKRAAALGDAVPFDTKVDLLDLWRIERGDAGALQEHVGGLLAPARGGQAAGFYLPLPWTGRRAKRKMEAWAPLLCTRLLAACLGALLASGPVRAAGERPSGDGPRRQRLDLGLYGAPYGISGGEPLAGLRFDDWVDVEGAPARSLEDNMAVWMRHFDLGEQAVYGRGYYVDPDAQPERRERVAGVPEALRQG